MTKKLLMVTFPAVLAAMMLLGSITGASLNQEVFAVKGGNEKVDICHNTNSETNPQVTINVSTSAIPAHLSHGDFVGTCEDGPDCEHESNAENLACSVQCEDCQDAYAAKIKTCVSGEVADLLCVIEANEAFADCVEKNDIDPSTCPASPPPDQCREVGQECTTDDGQNGVCAQPSKELICVAAPD